MKVPICTKPQSAVPRVARWLAASLLIVLFTIPSLAVAQGGCAGAIDVENDGSNFAGISVFSDYYDISPGKDLPESIVWTLNPKAGGSLIVTTNQVQFALTCANNGDSIPCSVANDEQAGTPGVTPLVYTQGGGAGNPTGTCGATLNSNALGVVTFDLPNTDLDATGCTIVFSTELEDIGGGGTSPDTTPKLITSAVGYQGTCENGSLEGNAAGSIAVEVWDPEIDVTKTGPTLAKVGDNIEYEIGCTVVTDPEAIDVCTGNDPLFTPADLGVFDCVAGQKRKFNYTVLAGDPNPLKNTATITCSTKGSANTVTDNASWDVPTIAPAITATKTGPKLAKVGDEITYTIGFTATKDGQALGVCTGNDPLFTPADLGVFVSGTTRDFKYTVMAGDPNPLKNEVTITCDITGRTNKASAKAQHEVELIDPAITVTKIGPTEAKVGDEITYTIGFTATSNGDLLGTCTGNDPLFTPADLGVFVSGTTRDFKYTVMAGDPNPLKNEVTITCDITGRTNKASGKANWDVTLFKVDATLTKTCAPKSIAVPGDINWEICVVNTGDKALDCLIDDDQIPYTAEPLSVPVGSTPACLQASRATTSGDVPSIKNVAGGSCTVALSEGNYTNKVTLPDADATCEVTQVEELCRTPGFWKAHAGLEKDGRSNNLTQTVIDYNGGTLGTICGVEIMDTSTYNYAGTGYDISNGYKSAVEGMCVHPKQRIVRQLQRQLIAAAINCVVSGGSADCTGLLVGDNWKAANASCLAEDGEMSSWVDEIDDFNNGVGDYTCTPNIQDSIVFDGWTGPKLPGPAGSSNACSAATSNDFYLVPLPSGLDP